MNSWRALSLDYRDPAIPFEEVVRLIDLSGSATGAAYSRSDVVEALHEHQPAVVAVSSGALVGAIVARVCGADAHLMTLALHPQWRQKGIGSALLRQLDQEIIHRGARRLLAFVHPGQVGELAFSNQGFTRQDGLHLYARDASMIPEELAIVERFGGQVLATNLWGSLKGFSSAKEILERRVVAPLAHVELAEQLGLVPPAAVLLFGPPGTGKTSFAGPLPPGSRGPSSRSIRRCWVRGWREDVPCGTRCSSWAGSIAWCASSTRRMRSPRTGVSDPTANRWSTSCSRRCRSSSPGLPA